MAKLGQVWEKNGKFGISFDEGVEPAADAYTYDTKEAAQTEAKARYDKSVVIEESCAGGSSNKTAAHLNI